MEKNDQQNFMLAIGIIGAILLVSQIFLWGPNDAARREAAERAQVQLQETATAEERLSLPRAREEVISEGNFAAQRILLDAPAIDGSISLKGARIDDVSLKRHFVEVDREEEVHLLSPQGSQEAFYAFNGWRGEAPDLPDANTDWELVQGTTLAPGSPVNSVLQLRLRRL